MKRTVGAKIDTVATLVLKLALSLAVSLQAEVLDHVTDRDLAIYRSVLHWNAEENLHGVARINNLIRRHTIAINDGQIKKLARQNEPGEYAAFRRLAATAAYRSLIDRARIEVPISRIPGTRRVEAAPSRLQCIGANCEIEREVFYEFTLPGYARSYTIAAVYVRAADYFSAADEICVLRRSVGIWKVQSCTAVWGRGE
jgi:hypothetical protein